MKRCSQCKQELEPTQFNKYARSKDGLRWECWCCQSAKRQQKRARKYEATSTLTGAEIRAQFERQGRKCYHCQEPVGGQYDRVVDHLTSMCRGGTNTAANIVISCIRCNGERWIHDEMHTYFDEQRKGSKPVKWGNVTADELLTVIRQAGDWITIEGLRKTLPLARPGALIDAINYLVRTTEEVQQRSEKQGYTYTFYFKVKS